MNNNTVNVSTSLSLRVVACNVCGIIFAVPSGMMNYLAGQGAPLFCPNGHQGVVNTVQADPPAPVGSTSPIKRKKYSKAGIKPKPYICPFCGNHYITENYARIHIREKHPDSEMPLTIQLDPAIQGA